MAGTASSRKPTQSELLIGYVEYAELFHDSGGDSYATVGVDAHVENWPLKGERFGQCLLGRWYRDTGKAPSAQALTDARATIGARAIFEGRMRPVFRSVARDGDAVYLDLCNDEWEAVEITASGWRVIPSGGCACKVLAQG